MLHPLQQQVDHIRRRARRVRLLHAFAWLVATALAAGLLLGLGDFLLRSEELGVRLLLSVAFVGAIIWAGWRFAWPALSRKSSIVQIAQHIENRWPHLQDRLSSSLEFLSQPQDDPEAGSPALRRTVVSEATAQIEGLPLDDIVDHRRPFPVLITAGVLLLVVVLLSLAAPQTAARAARRLTMPWTTGDAWPRRHELALVDPPSYVPYGEPFRAEVIDRKGEPPELVEIYYWFDGQDSADVQPQTMKLSGETLVHQLGRVTRPFKFRAVGGDDDTMRWHAVEVVEPPRVESLSITLHPPEYTALKPHETSRHIHAISGTSVTLSGQSTKPLSTARIVVEASDSASGDDSSDTDQVIPLQVEEDQRSFTLPAGQPVRWELAAAGNYRLILAGTDGVESGVHERYQLDIVPDEPPKISVDSPEANSFVTADARVPVKAEVADDLAIARIELHYSRSDRSDVGEEVVVLYEGTEQPSLPSSEAASSRIGETRSVDYEWDLSNLQNLSPGTALSLSLVASDYRPQQQQSPPRRITIITPDQLEDRIVQRQTFLLGQLADALAIQREARSQTKAIEIQFAETETLSPKDVVDLQSAELNQRRVDRLLAGEHDGVLAQIDTLLDVARQNRLDNPDLERRIGDLQKAIRQLSTDVLPAVGRDLLTALKAGQTAMHASGDKPVGGAPLREVDDSLGSAGEGQQQAIEHLERLLGDLSQWDSYRRFSRQVSSLRRDQQAIAQRTSELRLQTLSKNMQQLSAQERAELSKLSQRQVELARQIEQMLKRMDDMRQEMPDDPVAAQTLGDAVELARSGGVSSRMRQTSRQIEQNQLGQATQQQQQLGEQLDELLDTLTGRREHQLERRLEELNDAAEELRGLRSKSQQMQADMESASQNPDETERRRQLDRLEAQRSEQQEEVERLARRLERLQAEQAAQSLSQAAEHSQQAGEAAAAGDEAQRQQQSDLAEEDLANAQQQLEQQIKQIEQDLLEEQLARLEQSLEGMIVQQENINDETVRIQSLLQQNESLTRGQLASVATLAQQQRGLMSETTDFADKIAAAEVFHLGLTSAVREMAGAAVRLEAAEIDDRTQQLQGNALRRLRQLADAMKAGDDAQLPENAGAGSSSGGSQGQGPDGIQQLAQLKLLKLMQQSLKDRTNQLEDVRSGREWNEREQAEIVQLAKEQGRLAELLLELSKPVEQASEAAPESLPDFGEDLDQQLQEILDEFGVTP